MAVNEKAIIDKIINAVPKMSDFDKGYWLGKAEALEEQDRKLKVIDRENNRMKEVGQLPV